MITKSESVAALPSKLYRGLKVATFDWPGTRVSDDSLLMKVHEANNSNKSPLIWCGYVENLELIVSVCGKDRDIYAIRGPVGLFRPSEHVVSLLGRYYAEEIEKAIPSGSYMLAGLCLASRLAVEIATILIQKGHQIPFLGFVETDISTGHTWLNKYTRKVFNRVNYHGTRFRSSLNAIKNSPPTFAKYIRNIPTILKDSFGKEPAEFHLDVDKDIYKFRKDRDVMYEIKEYPGFINLFYIRWAIFGFYQFKFFQRYWREIASDGIKVDFVNGFAHQFPNWNAIIARMNKRILETGK